LIRILARPSLGDFGRGGARVQAADGDVDDDAVVRGQFVLELALDVQVGGRDHALAEVQILVDAVPDVGVELARREDVDAGAFFDSDIGDDIACVVGEVCVQRVGQDAEVSVEKVDDDQGKDGGDSGLHDCADLEETVVSLDEPGNEEGTGRDGGQSRAYDASRHGGGFETKSKGRCTGSPGIYLAI
jgi:hypothetical protein